MGHHITGRHLCRRGETAECDAAQIEGAVFAIAPCHRHSEKIKDRDRTDRRGIDFLSRRCVFDRDPSSKGRSERFRNVVLPATRRSHDFAGKRHPYDMPADLLLEDALALEAIRADRRHGTVRKLWVATTFASLLAKVSATRIT
jgi:hypothetical protein